MNILLECSPVAWAYLDPLADTGITRVIKNYIVSLDRVAEGHGFKIYLVSQQGYGENYLLAAFLLEMGLHNIRSIVDGTLAVSIKQAELCQRDLLMNRFEMLRESPPFELNEFLMEFLNTEFIWHASFLSVPTCVRESSHAHIVHTIHDLFPLTHRSLFPLPSVEERISVISSYESTDYFACVSEYTKSEVLRCLFVSRPERVIAISNAADHYSLPRSAEGKRTSSVLMSNLEPQKYFISISTREPRKNFSSIVKAALLFNRQVGGYKFLMVGSVGWLSDAENRLLEESGSENIIWVGRLDEQALENALANALCLISASTCEGFGLPNLEALMRGVPVICPMNSAQEEVVGPYSIVLGDWSPTKIVAAMQEVIDPAVRAVWVKKVEHIALSFSWRQAALQYIDLYKYIGNSSSTDS